VIVAVAVGGTAIALAATGGGPVPPPKPLATAAHDALAAPAPEGVTARVSFTNHLISSSSIEGTDPILTGASGRLWLAPGHFRIELQSERGDAQLVAGGKSFWVYDPRSNTVYRGALPQDWTTQRWQKDPKDIPSLDQVKQFLSRLTQHTAVSAASPSDVAGRAAYTVRVSPKQNGGLIGAGELAWDAGNGIPLRIGVYAKGASSPVLALTVKDVSFGPVSSSSFDISPPPDAKVVQVDTPSGHQQSKNGGEQAPVTGVVAVGKAVSFTLSAPDTLAGMQRQEVRLLNTGKGNAALVTYGHGPGGIAVLERASDPNHPIPSPQGGGDHHGGLDLPTVSIGGVQAQELATPLGTALQFERGGVAYAVIGSVPPATAEAAAQGL
jgi:outer membrane lipoprotein-sorting protein